MLILHVGVEGGIAQIGLVAVGALVVPPLEVILRPPLLFRLQLSILLQFHLLRVRLTALLLPLFGLLLLMRCFVSIRGKTFKRFHLYFIKMCRGFFCSLLLGDHFDLSSTSCLKLIVVSKIILTLLALSFKVIDAWGRFSHQLYPRRLMSLIFNSDFLF